jgi:23S rRNA pseudouridine1911/1915/1917 synthase
VTRNGILIKSRDVLFAGEVVVIKIDDDTAVPSKFSCPLDIVFEDEDVIAVNKPHGMVVHPTKHYSGNTLSNAVAYHMSERGEYAAFRPVNRLDRDTSGLVVAGKNIYSASRLSGSVSKTYLAVCEGELSGSGTIDTPIAREEGHSSKRKVSPEGDRSVTHWTVLCSLGGMTLLEIRLETGRTHQIRVHFSSIGMPLCGDDLYGGGRELIGRQALHCREAEFVHPVSGEIISLSAPVPNDMAALPPCRRYAEEMEKGEKCSSSEM